MKVFSGNIEEDVLNLLFQRGPLLTTNLIERIRGKRGASSKQGVYRVLRKLAREEKIVIYKSIVSVGDVWVEKLRSLLETGDPHPSLIGDLGSLKESERVSLHVQGLNHCDQLWSHIFQNIERTVEMEHPLYLFNPHNWFIVLREETEKVQMEALKRKQRPAFLIVSGDTSLDQATRERVQSKSFEVSSNKRIRIPDYIAVLGDFLIRVKLLGEGNRLIDTIFQQKTSFQEARDALMGIDKKISSRIVIERNKKKAREWKKRLSRDFLIPKSLKDF